MTSTAEALAAISEGLQFLRRRHRARRRRPAPAPPAEPQPRVFTATPSQLWEIQRLIYRPGAPVSNANHHHHMSNIIERIIRRNDEARRQATRTRSGEEPPAHDPSTKEGARETIKRLSESGQKKSVRLH